MPSSPDCVPAMGGPQHRLFVDGPLLADGTVALGGPAAHYLRNVLRAREGDAVTLFNGRDGEWLARITRVERDSVECIPERRLRPQAPEGDLWLAFAPIKRARIDLIAEKATELGAARLVPVVTERTNAARVNGARLRAHAVEAAEQCGRLTVPEVAEPAPLEAFLAGFPGERRLLAAAPGAPPLAESELDGAPLAVLIGPEGGFSPAELDRLRRAPFVTCVGLGPRILRAETAAIAALAVVQSMSGRA